MGVATIPKCHRGAFCDIVNDIVKLAIYDEFVQSHIGPAGYFRDPKHISQYETHSNFLPDANNERNFNQSTKDRLS